MLLPYRQRLPYILVFFFFNDTATTEIYTLSLHDALPIFTAITPSGCHCSIRRWLGRSDWMVGQSRMLYGLTIQSERRSEEHTSELQSQSNLVCRLLLEKKNL